MLLGITYYCWIDVNVVEGNVKAKIVTKKVQLQALVDEKKVIITESTVRRDLQLEDVEGADCLPNASIFEQLTLMGYEKILQKLTFYKAFFPYNEIPYSYYFAMPKKTKKKDTELTQTSGPTTNIADEAVNEEMDDHLERVDTTTSSLEAEQDSSNINKTDVDEVIRWLRESGKVRSQIRNLGLEAYAMTWKVLNKKMTDKYCPQGELKKLDIELWNPKFVANENEKFDKYINGIPDNIYGNNTLRGCPMTTYVQPLRPSLTQILKIKEQLEEEESRALQSINETSAQKASKRRKLNEEVEDLKRHLEIVPDEDDDVYTEVTPLARKVPVVDYENIHLNTKPHYKIIRADGTHQLYVSFLTFLKKFDREDLESLWSLVKERFSTSKPNNFSDDFLLTTLEGMFKRPDGQAYLILLVERRYPLSRFTLDQMLNAVRLRVEEQSEMSLELLRFTRKHHQEGQLE
nr:hypothetical protein [Tanacetum cinerariifolium]